MEETFFEYSGNEYISGLNKIVQTQIMNFLDPDKKIVYNIFKSGALGEHKLYTISSDNYIKTEPYSKDININLKCNKATDFKFSYKGKDSAVINKINSILPFYLDSNDNNIDGFSSGFNVTVNVKSSNSFEDDINNALSNEIQNVYLENGSCTDVRGNPLSGDTIYKEVDGNLEPLQNPPYKVYDIGSYNSLVSIENSISSSAGDSKYLRISGDKHSNTALEFTGGKLRTVSYNRFKDL